MAIQFNTLGNFGIGSLRFKSGGIPAGDLLSYPDLGVGGEDFKGLTALPAGWTFVDASANCTLTVEDGKAKISLPASNHDPGTTAPIPGEGAPRIERAQADTDFDFIVALATDCFMPPPDVGNGIYVRWSDNSTARHDIYRTADTVPLDLAYVQVRSAGSQSIAATPKGAACFIRLTRIGNNFTFQASLDGSTWTTISSYTSTGIVEAIGTYAFNFDTGNPAYTAEIEYVAVNVNLPTVNDPVTRTPLLSLDGSAVPGAPDWSDESVTGGVISSNGTDLTLSVTTTDRSSAAFLSTADQPANIGALVLVREDIAQINLFFGILLRGGSTPASQYGPIGHIFEGGSDSAFTRMVKQSRSAPALADGGMWSYPREWNATALPLTATATWVRYEAIGPVLRSRTWADGGAEPATWEQEYVDHTFYESGRVGMVLSKNDGTAAGGDIQLESIEFYEITK